MPAERVLANEHMDNPNIDPTVHQAALRGLARLNWLSRAAAPIADSIKAASLPTRSPTLLDVATGSGDVALGVVRRLRRTGLQPTVVLVDVSDRALQEAAKRFRAQGITTEHLAIDVTTDPLPACDVAMCSLFLHHLEDTDTARVLGAMHAAARHLCVVTDLARSWLGLQLTRLVPRLVTRSPVVHTDAVLSAKAAYTASELYAIARAFHTPTLSSSRVFPCRQRLTWRTDTER